MTVNNALNYTRLRSKYKFKIQHMKYIIRCNETQNKAANYQENINLKTHFKEKCLYYVIWFQFFSGSRISLLISGIGLK